MKTLRALLILGRVSNLPTVWSNCLAGWFLGWGNFDLNTLRTPGFALLILASTMFYIAGMFLNDAFDADWDRTHRTERPIPSGAIESRTVWWLGIAGLAIGMGITGCLGNATAITGLLLMNCILIYNFIHKHTAWSVLFMGGCRALLILLAGAMAYAESGRKLPFLLSEDAGAVTWAAVAMATYVIGLSCMARAESKPAAVDWWPALLMISPVIPAILVYDGKLRDNALLLCAVLALWVFRNLRFAFAMNPRQVGRAVGGWLAGIVIVDMIAVASAPPRLGCVFLALFILALLLQKKVPAT